MADISDAPTASVRSASATSSAAERRTNHALRALVDEMMSSIRAATQGELWTAEERAQYERELANIMGRVRNEAVSHGPPDDAA
jgi:hypothetical protein